MYRNTYSNSGYKWSPKERLYTKEVYRRRFHK